MTIIGNGDGGTIAWLAGLAGAAAGVLLLIGRSRSFAAIASAWPRKVETSFRIRPCEKGQVASNFANAESTVSSGSGGNGPITP